MSGAARTPQARSSGGDGDSFGAGEARVVLEVARVTKTYPSAPPVTALRQVSLTVTAGELVAVAGPSWSVKTTLLHVMGSLDRPSAGTVKITGLDVAALSDRQLAALRAGRVGFVFQQFFLAEHTSVLDNVADGLLYAGVPIRQRRERAAEALAAVGLPNRLHARPTQISGGQRQRVAIARALVRQPAIVWRTNPPATSTRPPARPARAARSCTPPAPPSW
jgi:putative ABC transport system ATP-binding protein